MARTLPTIPYTVEPLTEAESLERADAFFDAMDARRSVREFSDRPVPRALIEHAIATAGTAPLLGWARDGVRCRRNARIH